MCDIWPNDLAISMYIAVLILSLYAIYVTGNTSDTVNVVEESADSTKNASNYDETQHKIWS
jgi:hypothetical protein